MSNPPGLESLADFLSEGQPLNGCNLSIEQAVAVAQLRAPLKPYCVVKDWTLVNLSISESERDWVGRKGLHPFLIYAENVVFDSAERLAAGDWVRTGLAISEMTDGFLETRNTLYIALGNGQLKQASPALVMAII